MMSYSPYDQVGPMAYPAVLATGGLSDPRVTYWEPAKWTAKLRELKTDNNTLVFKTNMGAGHFGVSGRFDHLWEMAEEYAFILHKFGMKS
jgi:oligopeptidase B